MKRAAKTITTICTILLIHGWAFAHEGENHAKSHKEDVKMDKLHKMMPLYAQAEANMNEALLNGNAATIKKEAGIILATIPDLKSAKPHKNLDELATFRKIASAFEGDIKKTASMAKAGDFAGAKDAFQLAQKRCDECHAKFRD